MCCSGRVEQSVDGDRRIAVDRVSIELATSQLRDRKMSVYHALDHYSTATRDVRRLPINHQNTINCSIKWLAARRRSLAVDQLAISHAAELLFSRPCAWLTTSS